MARDPQAGDSSPAPPAIAEFLDEEPPRDLGKWRWLWQEDARFPVRSHRGLPGRLIVFCKRLLRPVVEAPQRDLWDRQRVFNLILLESLEQHVARLSHRIDQVETLAQDGLRDVTAHDDALYARVDQKLERYRRETKDLQGRLSAGLAKLEAGVGAAELQEARREADYVAFEDRYRGTPEEIRSRLAAHLPLLAGQGPVLDLGCGRGELLDLLREQAIPARGVDGSAAMVAICRERGLAAAEQDLNAALAATPEGGLGAVVSVHVIEHLEPAAVERLVRLAFGALRSGGLLLLETPNVRSLRVGASRFWIDPTHRRPVHPEALRWMATSAGFDPVEIRDLHPFPAADRLPELPIDVVPAELRSLVDRLNRQRDRLDDLLHGFQDVALVARKP
jgi:SAM-dependent methyltransferase